MYGKKLVRQRIDDVVRDEWQHRMTSDTNIPCVFLKISKSNPKLSKYCQNCIKFISMMFSKYRLMSCPSCYMLINNQTEHTILFCCVTEIFRKQLWHTICSIFGFAVLVRTKRTSFIIIFFSERYFE